MIDLGQLHYLANSYRFAEVWIHFNTNANKNFIPNHVFIFHPCFSGHFCRYSPDENNDPPSVGAEFKDLIAQSLRYSLGKIQINAFF